MSSGNLYILYNADASVMGKLKYGYRKICKSSEDNPACAACAFLQIRHARHDLLTLQGDITHGGLSLQETPAWITAKEAIEIESGLKVVQWHRDELSPEASYVTQTVHKRLTTYSSKALCLLPACAILRS